MRIVLPTFKKPATTAGRTLHAAGNETNSPAAAQATEAAEEDSFVDLATLRDSPAGRDRIATMPTEKRERLARRLFRRARKSSWARREAETLGASQAAEQYGRDKVASLKLARRVAPWLLKVSRDPKCHDFPLIAMVGLGSLHVPTWMW